MSMHHMERHLARCALGLRNVPGDDGRNVSYRNRYTCTLNSHFGAIWQGMVNKGWAEVVGHWPAGPVKMAHFRLTRAGAELVLAAYERLCWEHFPPQAQP